MGRLAEGRKGLVMGSSDITVEELGEVLKLRLKYNADSGLFTWVDGQCANGVAGTLTKKGYIAIKVGYCCKQYTIKAHRLAWFFVMGTWPTGQIDHINGMRTDNRIVNLRDVTPRQNSQNKKHHRSGKLVGCRLLKGKWDTRIHYAGTTYYLGRYTTEQEANDVYKKVESMGEEFAIEFSKQFKKEIPKELPIGIYYNKQSDRFVVQKRVDGKSKHFGSYKTLEEAIEINNKIRSELCQPKA